jgi:signal transduction histidine kinase
VWIALFDLLGQGARADIKFANSGRRRYIPNVFQTTSVRWIALLVMLPLTVLGQGKKPIQASAVRQFCWLDTAAEHGYEQPHNPDVLAGAPRSHLTWFRIFNDRRDTAHLAYYPGPAASVAVWELHHGRKRKLPFDEERTFFLTARATCTLSIPPGDTLLYNVLSVTYDSPYTGAQGWLLNPGQFDTFFAFYDGAVIGDLLLYIAMAGMLLMMLIYISAKFIQIKKTEYAYYAGYIGFLFLYVLLKSQQQLESPLVTRMGPWYSYINNMLQVCAYCMYFPFLTKFLDTRQGPRVLHRQLHLFTYALLAYIVVDAMLIEFQAFGAHVLLWNVLRSVLFVLVIAISAQVYRMHHPYGVFPIIGGLSLDFFALASMIFSLHHEYIHELPGMLHSNLLYYFLGIIIELLFFSLGLGYKNRRDEVEKVEALESLKLARERQKFDHLRSVVEVQENERARIAKDLHDGVGGLLSGISISLSNLKEGLPLNLSQRLQYERSVDLLNSSVQELRRVAHDMMPASLLEFGCAAALSDYCKAINSMKSIEVIFQVLGNEVRQEPSREVVIYRIVQELINNILKHAQARQALVQLSFAAELVSITVEDDGEGFDYARERVKGSGLSNIRSRVEYLKGVMDIESAPKKGSSVHIEVPWTKGAV